MLGFCKISRLENLSASISGHSNVILSNSNLTSFFQFDPELVFVCAGFDSAIGDPEVNNIQFIIFQ